MTSVIFRWLHLSDLHVGLSIGKRLWPGFKTKFFDDLSEQYEKSGPWDAVFFTGDLTQMGKRGEFEELDDILEELWGHFKDLGADPTLIAIPGNHDLTRPAELDPNALAFSTYWDKIIVQERLLDGKADTLQSFLDTAFVDFSEWQKRQIGLGRHATPEETGLLAGDASYILEIGENRIGVVGLNSTWLQLGGGDYKGKLALDQRQLLAVTQRDPDRWCRANDANLILTHHPTDWLHEHSLQAWPSEIDTNERFTAHLFGHMHEHDQRSVSHGGGQTRRSIQASSLFGLEIFDGGKEQRIQGYSLSQLRCDGSSRTMRVWPRVLNSQKDNDRRITADIALGLKDDQFYDVACTARPRRRPSHAEGTQVEIEPVQTASHSGANNPSNQPKPAAQILITLASKPEVIATELQKISHYVPNDPAHANVRTLERRSACSALTSGRIMWSIADWGMGEDGFLGRIQSDLGEIGRATYTFDFSDYTSREAFFVVTQERFGVPFEVLCANIATVGIAYIIFNDIPVDREPRAGHSPIEIDVEGIAILLSEFAPEARILLRAARAPRGATRYPIVEIKSLDEADVAVYLREHPQGGHALASPETVHDLFRNTDGVPSRLDIALRKLGVSSLRTVLSSDTDRGDRAVTSSFPPALMNAVAHIEQAQKTGLGSPFDLLRALACLPRGDQIEGIARLNGPKALRPDDALMLVGRGLLDSAPASGLNQQVNRTDAKTLMVPRPVREYVRSQLTEAQARSFDRKMIDIYFGRKWSDGKITGSRAGRNAVRSLCEMHVVNNSCALIIRYIGQAVSKRDNVQTEAGIRLASAFVACLKNGSHYRAAADLCGEVLALVPVEGYIRQRTILELDRARNLRMTRNWEVARDLLLGLDTSYLSKTQHQSAQLNLALIYERLKEPEEASRFARDCIATDRRSDMALQAKTILLEQEQDKERRSEQLQKLRQQSGRKKAYVNANNIALTLADSAITAGNIPEALRLLREVMACADQAKDFYNGARAIAQIAHCLSNGRAFDRDDKDRLMAAYHFAHTERLAGLFDRCHRGLWKAFEADGDIENLLRLYRSSSFIWRLHGRDDIERSYLEKLRILQGPMISETIDHEYFMVRVSLVFGNPRD